MTAQTSRYKLTYPTGSDLVSGAPAQFKSLAESVDKALGEVDDRQTENAVKPVVRTTLAQLQDASAVTGQTGYVTDDGTNNGMYVYTGSAWAHARTYTTQDKGLTYLVQNQNGWTVRYLVRHGVLWMNITLNGTGTGNWSDVTCPATLPEALRPPMVYSATPINTNNQSNGRFRINEDGTILYRKLGGNIITDEKSCTVVYPVA